MKVCFFGIYDPTYARNRVLMSGFEANGYTVIECRADPVLHSGWHKYYALWRRYRTVRHEQFTHVIVAFPGHSVVWLARLLFGRRIVFDAFLSLYDSNVSDRRSYRPRSLRAMRDWLLDWHACMLASRVLLDTHAHIDFFSKTFGIARKKFLCVPIGADESLFYPRVPSPRSSRNIIHFHGTFIPLQGIQTILEAARLARSEPWLFRIVGSGQEFGPAQEYVHMHGLNNVVLLGKKNIEQVSEYISSADICLGIFGNTNKAQRVIPNKVYECIAMAKPVVTAITPAIEEYFSKDETIFMCKGNDPKSLYEALKNIFANYEHMIRVAKQGRRFFEEHFAARIIVGEMLSELSSRSWRSRLH